MGEAGTAAEGAADFTEGEAEAASTVAAGEAVSTAGEAGRTLMAVHVPHHEVTLAAATTIRLRQTTFPQRRTVRFPIIRTAAAL
jgi:hypothetical protein